MREGLLLIPSPNFSAGITPACAGRTTHALVYLEHRRDHPRVCGKDTISRISQNLTAGSPPLSREGRQIISRVRILRRITPACAGRTSLKSPYNAQPQDHPRMCGKDRLHTRVIRFILGSPPHVREGRLARREEMLGIRITPACAGRTHNPLKVSLQRQDHPRVCGKDKATSI